MRAHLSASKRPADDAERRIVLLAHNVRSLWNVGSFFRSADAFRVEKIILTGYTGHPPRREITKTALGAEETIPWEHRVDPFTVFEDLRREGWIIVALELHERALALREFLPSAKICLVVGHELTGLPEDILSLCDQIVAIPMLGGKESLNVAVAAGIALYHLRHGRKGIVSPKSSASP